MLHGGSKIVGSAQVTSNFLLLISNSRVTSNIKSHSYFRVSITSTDHKHTQCIGSRTGNKNMKNSHTHTQCTGSITGKT
jgi:hypothetical protein